VSSQVLKPSVDEVCVASTSNEELGLIHGQKLPLKGQWHAIFRANHQCVHGNADLVRLKREYNCSHGFGSEA
jgi:hypothetical protein